MLPARLSTEGLVVAAVTAVVSAFPLLQLPPLFPLLFPPLLPLLLPLLPLLLVAVVSLVVFVATAIFVGKHTCLRSSWAKKPTSVSFVTVGASGWIHI
jgi:hypothetical protein